MERISNWLLSGAAALSLVVTPLAAISPASAGISQNPYYFDGMVTPSLGDGEYRTAFPNWDNYTDSWYFADHDSGRVVNFDANGNFINSFGNAGPEQTPLNYPHDVGVNSQGYTFVSDSESVKAFNAEGVLVAKDVYFGGQKMNSGYISGTHITTDNAGNLYACAYFGSTTIVKLSVAQGRINAEQLIPGSDTCNRYGGANLQVSEDGLVILAAGSPGTIVWANIGGTWKQTFSFLGTEWNSWGNYWLSDEDGTYEVHVLSFDRTTQRKYDPLTGELLGSSTVTNSSALPIARNRSSYFDGITQFALAGPKALWVQSRDGLRRLDLNSNQLTTFGFTNFASASSVSVAANGNINVSDYLGNFLTLNSSGLQLSKVQLEHFPADVSSASYTTDGNIITSYVREDKSAAAALLDPQGRLITDYGTYRGLTSFTITSTGWFPAIHRAYPIACQVLNESNGTYIYYGTRYGNTMVNESCSGRGSAQIQIVENFDSPTESFKTVTLNFPDDSRHYAVGNLALAPNGNILMAAEGEFVWIFDPSGNHIGTIPQPRDTRPNQFGTLDFDNEGTLYVGYGAGVARFKSLKTFTQTPRPSITGKAAVGSTIIADSGTWDQNASLGYQWLRDGDAISGATNSSYLVTSSDFGHSLAVQVTGTGVGYSEVSVTSATKLVVAGSFTLTPVPVVEGVFESGGTLTAVTGLWDANAVLSFQWLRDGVVISGATSRDYRLTGADFGREISVRVTGSATGYTTVERTSVSSVVALGSQPASSVQVSGKFAVGQVLTANVFAGVSGASASFQWLRDGVVIAGATGATYELTADDLNQDVSVRVVLVADGFRDLTATSSAQSVALGSITGSHSARVSDTPNVGKQVEVVVEGKSVLESVSYRWFREGLPIAGATQVAYTPSRTDYLKYISAQVTFSRAGFNDLVIEIEPQLVAPGSFSSAPTPSVDGQAQTGSRLTAMTGNWDSNATLSFEWLRDGAVISGANSDSYVTVGDDFGRLISVRVTGSSSGYTTVQKTSSSRVVSSGTQPGSSVQISGSFAVGQVLTANAFAGVSGASASYQWLRDGVVISGATDSSYELTAADLNQDISVSVLVSAQGYSDVSVTSSVQTVVLGTISSINSVRLGAMPYVGKSVSATFSGKLDTDSVSYKWFRDGIEILGATQSFYVPNSGDYLKYISAQLTFSRESFNNLVVDTDVQMVAAGSFTLTPVPVVEGVFESGGTLTAVTGLWDANAVLSFQWLRDGVVISGATSRDYRLTGADFGRDISVRVTGSATGYTSVERTSVSSVVALGSQPASSVQVSGKFAVGQVLTANVFAGVADAAASFQWLRDGVVIAGATGATYELTADDLNQDVSVRVVLVADGFRDLTATSSAQSVALGSITGSHSARVSDTPNVGKQVEVVVEGKSVLESVSYRWFREGLPIAGATQVAYTPSRTDYLKYISAQVTFSRAGFNDLVIEIEPQVVELSEESQGLNLAGLDLSSTDLTFYNFKDANLAGANFSTANLSYVNFKGANLTGANLATANFTFADFSGTNLTNADLSNGNAAFTLFVGANLNNANVTGLALDGRDFSQVDLSGVKGQLEAGPSQLPAEWSVVENRMVGPTANLSGANFSRASLKDLNLSGADLTNTNLVGADLTGTNLSGAKLTGVTFHPGTIEATSLVGAATVGSELRIAQTDWAKGIAYSYQWYVNGISLPGATSPTLVVNSKEFGKRLSLTVLAKSRNVTIGSVTSPSVLIGSGTMATKAVRLSGVAKVNSTVQVKVIPWVPGAKVSYQWYLEGKAIKGATSSSLKLLKSHKGRKVFLKVSQSATGYKTGSVSSNTVKVS